MVYSGEKGGGERVREDMAMGTERSSSSKPPLHNFNLPPLLKWGTQRQLRCIKVAAPDDAASGNKNGTGDNRTTTTPASAAVATDRCRSNRSPPTKLGAAARNYDVRRFKFPSNRRIVGGEEEEEGIEAVGEKIMLDLRTEADKMKDAFFRKELSEEDDGDVAEREEAEEEEEEEEEEDESASPPPRKASASPPRKTASSPAPAAVVADMDQGVRPWNLRTRRAAFKTPNGGNLVQPAKGLKIEERRLSNSQSPLRTDAVKSPRLRGEKEKEKRRPKFAVALSKREIEEDFMEILGHRPARRPKKRPRIVQKQLDTLFPGLWLTEVTPDMYKVHENPDNAKR